MVWYRLRSLPHSPDFSHLWKRKLLKTLWEKEKILITSIFSFSHNVFYPSKHKFQLFCHNCFVIYKCIKFRLHSCFFFFLLVLSKFMLQKKEKKRESKQNKSTTCGCQSSAVVAWFSMKIPCQKMGKTTNY